jgi:hypothetical protein
MQDQKRDLEESIQRAQKKLQVGMEKWRRLHHQRQTLKHRIATMQPSLLMTPSPTPSPSPMQSTCFAEPALQSVPVSDVKDRFHSPALLRHGTHPRKQSQNTVRHQIVPGSRHSRYNKDRAAPSLKPISAFKHHAIISFSILSKFMTSQEFRSSSHLNLPKLRQAFLMCQTETAQRLRVSTSEICWFLEWPYEALAQQRLCTNISTWSSTCKLTFLVAEIALTIECMFLVMEHELLSSVADPYYKPRKHPILDAAASTLPQRPNLPYAAVLAAHSVRCSVKVFVPVEVALRRVVQPLVQQFSMLLPQRNWLAVCIQLMRVSATLVEVLRSMPNHNPDATYEHATEGEPAEVEQSPFEVCIPTHCLLTFAATCSVSNIQSVTQYCLSFVCHCRI